MPFQKLQNLKNALASFRTAAKVVIFESDDWGLNLMSRQARDTLVETGLMSPDYVFGNCGRETVEDLDRLYDVLSGFRDADGRHPTFTANFVMANPDYRAIEESGFRDYSWIAIDDTELAPECGDLIPKYGEGIERGLICPQYHGRDHFSAETWLDALREGDAVARSSFDLRVPRIGVTGHQESEYTWGEGNSLRPLPPAVIDAKIEAGMAVFRRMFGRSSLTSIAPCYLWCDHVETSLGKHGVRCMQAASHRVVPAGSGRLLRPRPALLGTSRGTAMRQLVRNARFEPAQSGQGAIAQCLQDVAAAFARGYPATIDTHRVNYVGVVDPGMRDRSLRALRELLDRLLACYSEVRFVTSEDLANAILRESTHAGYFKSSGAGIVRGSFGRRIVWLARERWQWWRENGHTPCGPGDLSTPACLDEHMDAGK